MNKNLPGFEKQEWWVKNALYLRGGGGGGGGGDSQTA